MARRTFPQDRMAYRVAGPGSYLYSAATTTVVVYADEACTVLADIQDLEGAPLAGSALVVDATSQLPRFLGPADGTSTLWVKGAGSAVALTADVGTRVEDAEAALSAHLTAPDAHGDRAWAQGQFDAAGSASAAQVAAASDAASRVAAHVAATDPHGDRAWVAGQFDPAGAAAAVQVAAAADATGKVSAHAAASDPHGDRAWATSQFDAKGAATAAQSAASTDAASKVAAHASAPDAHGDRAWASGQFDPAGAASAAQTAAATDATSKVAVHASAADPHGDRAWATGQFDVAGAATAAQTAAAADATSKVSTHAGAADPHGDRADAATKYTPLNDTRLTNSRAPSGAASGDLSGTYPGPTVAKVNGVAVSGTPTSGQVPTATSGTAATWQTPAAPPSASGTVASETAFGQAAAAGSAAAYARGDHSHGTPAMPRLDQVGAPTADVSMNSHKLTALTNGSAASDAAAFGQIPVAGTTAGSYAAGNDSRITGALQAASNLSDVANKVTGLINLGFPGKNCATAETNSTVTQQASTQLVVPVVANGIYEVSAKLGIQTPSGVNFVHGWSAPSGATMVWGDSSTFITTIGATDSWSGTGAMKWANIFGTLTVGGTAGNLTVTFASGTAANTATLGAGSHLALKRIG